MNDYKNKYIKYKNKYINLKNNLDGGLIGEIPIEKLLKIKNKNSIPEKIIKYVKMLTIPDTQIIRVGSSINAIQPYFSDIDIMNIIEKNMSTNELINLFILELKKIINNIEITNNVFFSDFKAGGKHWKVFEIMKENCEGLSLFDAIKIKDVVKLDIIGPYNERYVEMSTFFILKSNEGYVNVDNNYFNNFTNTLLYDIKKYKTIKPFKSVKRLWSYARILKKTNVLNNLKDLIKSNIALLAQINADVETIILLLEHNSNYDVEFILDELNMFKEKISSILDLNIDQEKVNLIIDNLILLFKYNKSDKTQIIDVLELLHDYLLGIINKQTIDYLNSIGFSFPDDEKSILEKIKSLFNL